MLFKFVRKKRRLENHRFFSTMNYWINIEIDNLPITNKMKKNVVTKFLKIKFNVFLNNFKNFVNEVENGNYDSSRSVELILVDSIKEFEFEARRQQIPDLFIEKYRKWDNTHTQITYDAIKSIIESKYYTTMDEQVAAILDILLFSFRLTIVDAEKTINDLNGELEKFLHGTIFDT